MFVISFKNQVAEGLGINSVIHRSSLSEGVKEATDLFDGLMKILEIPVTQTRTVFDVHRGFYEVTEKILPDSRLASFAIDWFGAESNTHLRLVSFTRKNGDWQDVDKDAILTKEDMRTEIETTLDDFYTKYQDMGELA